MKQDAWGEVDALIESSAPSSTGATSSRVWRASWWSASPARASDDRRVRLMRGPECENDTGGGGAIHNLPRQRFTRDLQIIRWRARTKRFRGQIGWRRWARGVSADRSSLRVSALVSQVRGLKF